MTLTSLPFLLFAAVTVLLYYLVPKRGQWIVLLIASTLFYAAAGGWYLPFILVTILTTFFLARVIESRAKADEDYIATHKADMDKDARKAYKAAGKKKRFRILTAGLILNFGILAVLKYTGFTVSTVNDILGLFTESRLTVPSLILPLGISFYTFRSTAYIIDVYRGNVKAQHNIITFGMYVCLFPQLIAGPIVRYTTVAEDLKSRKHSLEGISDGIFRFTVGVGKKVLIANQMGELWAQLKTDDGNGVLGAWIGIIAFTLQIYFDFSGYSDMARGLGNMLGFDFVKNFDYPYISKSITEFWRRWHISLSTWFKEYVYIPLGGNRKGKGRMVFNLFAGEGFDNGIGITELFETYKQKLHIHKVIYTQCNGYDCNNRAIGKKLFKDYK